MKPRYSMIGLVACLVWVPALWAQPVEHHPQPEQALIQKWAWADEQGQDHRDGYWIGYSIERLMGERSFIGSWSSRERRTSLGELIYNEKPEYDLYTTGPRQSDEEERQVVKEVAFLFRFVRGSRHASDIRVSNLSGHADLDDLPLFWLGHAEDDESLDLVQGFYEDAASISEQEDFVAAIALHDATGRVVRILSDILGSRADEEIREKAAFWLGQQDDPTALNLLIRTANEDRSMEVREQAVFAISQVDLDAATDALIDLAREGDREIREKAVFWLGQRASEKAVEALGEILEKSPDIELQKKAVFAITQLPNDQAVPLLIEIAKTHPRAAVRKQAIFWLGQQDDPRALETLIELVRG